LAAVYWIIKGLLQIPIALFLDKTDGEKDDFYAIIFGLMVSAVASFSLMMVTQMWQVYIVETVRAVGFAMYVPAWTAIFSRHLDKDHTAFDWAVQNSTISFGVGIAGLAGGIVASYAGFKFVFLMVGLLSLTSAGLLLFIPNLILPRKTSSEAKIIGIGLPH
jgi:predicted MFS family arabinose efflux permease